MHYTRFAFRIRSCINRDRRILPALEVFYLLVFSENWDTKLAALTKMRVRHGYIVVHPSRHKGISFILGTHKPILISQTMIYRFL